MSFTDLIFARLFSCATCVWDGTYKPLLPGKHIQQLLIHLIRFCGPQEIVSFLLLWILCVHWCLLCYVLRAFPLFPSNLHSSCLMLAFSLLSADMCMQFTSFACTRVYRTSIGWYCNCALAILNVFITSGSLWSMAHMSAILRNVCGFVTRWFHTHTHTLNRAHSVWFVSGLYGCFQPIPFTWRLFYTFFPVAISMRRKNRHILDHQSNWFIFRRLTFDYFGISLLFKCTRHTMSV